MNTIEIRRNDRLTTRRIAPILALVALASALSGCAAIEGIFKAGLWVGIIAVVALVALIGGAITLLKR